MLHIKDITSGVDTPIQKYQSFLYPKLKALWNIKDDVSFDSYGRAYRNNKDQGYMPEVFKALNGANSTDYKEVFFDDTNNAAVSFFSTGDISDYKSGSATVKVSLIIILNLIKVQPNPPLPWRIDEEIRSSVMNMLQSGKFGFEMTGVETGYKNVFKDFDGMLNKDTVTYRDRHPFYCFKINFNLLYNVND